ncbi:sigma-70 family RNA polymerase sigma factor [Streptomyces sp. NPDC002573]|uniref:sigma-70 family RNA polymerase sigma factor n=1 Tax=Streptomyces sp. NPDC002573 TaxID=3364651 RepID=UPI00368F21BB
MTADDIVKSRPTFSAKFEERLHESSPKQMGKELENDIRADDSFLGDLYVNHSAMLLRYAMKVGRTNRESAEDVVQETFFRAWKNAPKLRVQQQSARAWLLRVARNIIIDGHRAQSARPDESELVLVEALPPAPDEVDSIVLARAMLHALAELSPEHREVIVRLHCLDHSVAETARAIGVPTGTVKSRNHYALRVLRRSMVITGWLDDG